MICYVILALVLAFVWAAARSPFGLMLGAARQNEERVQAVGQTPYRLYLVAFTISGAITGLAGALFADLNRFVSPTMFAWNMSGEIMIFVILGGVGRVFGPVAGAALFILLEHMLGGLSEFWHVYLGAILLGVVLFARGGLYGLIAGREVAHD
jgi:branched-chain amino acid transport system permease protein